MRYLITGGCGFIGSHLADHLVKTGHHVVALDNLSTGRYQNIEHLDSHPHFQLIIGSVLDQDLVAETMRGCDGVFHLASAVGVKLIMEQPVATIETIFQGTDTVLRIASRYRKQVLITSTSEVYGKSSDVPFKEDGDRLEGPTDKQRWAYACAKALDEFLALAHWKEARLPVVVVRLFNTVGPRQTGQYGMVIPTFIRRALDGLPIEVHGDGQQSRCFGHVLDVVEALASLMHCQDALGQVVNIGSQDEVSILELAERVKSLVGSSSEIRLIPYSQAYGEGFEDMLRRQPDIGKVRRLIGWTPRRGLDQILRDVLAYIRAGTWSPYRSNGSAASHAAQLATPLR
ncbi:MAG: GDP-mannose 4,6-dehydratase [Bryobacteraceae bacterium]|nr:GDP-mannose 4,6-dehydratase [Bryobacteraceae bacterium]